MTTQTLKCEIPAAALKAALLFSGKHDVRGYLNGVCVDATPRGTRLITTDGHRLFCFQVATAPIAIPQRYVLARDVVSAAVKMFPGKHTVIPCEWSQTRKPDPERPGVTIVECAKIIVGGIATTDVQDAHGKFPEYERIVPRTLSGEIAHYNVHYLADMARAQSLLCGNDRGFLQVGHNGPGPGLAVLRTDAFAVIMPMRSGEPPTLPEWF